MATKDNEITMRFGADVTDLKKGIQEAKTQIRLANAEFKAASSGMDDWSKSSEGITAKLKQLKTVLENQEKILHSYESQLAEIVKEQGENSKGADEMRIKIANQQAAINKTTKEINDWENALEHVDDDIEEVGDDLEDTTSGGLNAFSVALGNLASNIISGVIDKLKDMAKETIEVGKNFDASMSNVAALSGATEDELAQLRDTAKEFGSTTKFSASEAADALGYMALAGWDSKQSMDALGGVLDLAAASGMGLAEASDLVTDYMSAFNMEAQDSAYFADLLSYAQANANTTVDALGGAFKNCAANLNAAGQDVETVTSLLAMMANQGLKGEKAGTALSAVMRDITKSMEDGAISIGDTVVQVMDANGNYRDLTDILKDVEAATYGMGDAEKASALSSTFTADSIKGLNLILNAGVTAAKDFEDELRNSSGTAKDMSDIMNDNLGGDLTALNSKLEGVQIAIYEKFEPALRKGVDVLEDLLDAVQFVTDHSTEFVAALTSIAMGIGAMVAYNTAIKVLHGGLSSLSIVTKITGAFKALFAVISANPIGIIVGLITTLVMTFITLWNTSEEFRNFWTGLWEDITGGVSSAADTVGGFFSELWTGISEVWGQAVEFFSGVWTSITEYASVCWTNISETWNVVADWFKKTVIEPVSKFFTNLFDTIKKLASSAWNGIKTVWNVVATWYYNTVIKPVQTFFTELFTIVQQLAEGCWIAIKAVWSLVSSWFNDNVIKPVRDFFDEMFTKIKTFAEDAWKKIKEVWSDVKNWFENNVIKPVKKFFEDLWNGIKNKASEAWDGIVKVWNTVSSWFDTNVVKPVGKFFSGMWDDLKKGASDAWEGVKKAFSSVTTWFRDTFSEAWTAVKNVFETGGKIFDGITDGITKAFKNVVNAIIRALNKVIAIPFNEINKTLDKVRDIEIAGIKPFSGLLKRFTVPEIPELARGGVLKRGQIGLLEGNGAEAVIPLENNRRWISATVKGLKSAMMEEGLINFAGRQSITNNYNFTQTNNSPKALSRLEIYRQTNNQLQFARGV